MRFRSRSGATYLSPLQRGLTLLGLFFIWFLLSITVFDDGKGNDHQDDLGRVGRRLLNSSNNKLASPFTPELHEISGDEDPYDEEGHIKKGICLQPAIEQFPRPLLGLTARRYGGVIFYIFIAVYMFIGLAIVCDDYFVPSLDKVSAVLNLDPDVAGATFMAAGSSGPELATALIGVFVSEDDIGVSGVIGSAVFNITLVIAVCALAAKQVLYLNWWPVVRDSTCYLLSIFVLLCTIANESVSWFEALIFLILYVLYCGGMAFNSKAEEIVKAKLPVPASWNVSQPVSGDDKNPEGGYGQMDGKGNINGQPSNAMEMTTKGNNDGTWTDVPMSPPNPDPRAPQAQQAVEPVEDPLEKPMDGNMFNLVKWAVLYPLHFICKWTIPDCRKPQMARFFVATFCMSVAWISLYSYFMVWMITVVGFTFAIPDTVMGLTFIAAGVSVPDALSGIAVVKEGHGDMAVSNAIGSNVFDILVCLGLPWFLKTAIVSPGSHVLVKSKGLVYSTFSLFSTVAFLIIASHFNGWRLDRKFGIMLLIWYFIFMIIAALYELNVFGEFNPPECTSQY